MPRVYKAGTFEGMPNSRWVKMYAGERYRVTCAELHLPPEKWTKELSYQAANAWWEKKLAEITNVKWQSEITPEQWQKLDHVRDVAKLLTANAQLESYKTLMGIGNLDGLSSLAHQVESSLNDSVPTDRSVSGLSKLWIQQKQDEARKGIRSADGADNERIALEHFVKFVGGSSPLEFITFDVWHRWYIHCESQIVKNDEDKKTGWSADTAAKVFRTARTFVDFCIERGALEAIPRNLHKKYRFERPNPEIVIFTNDEIKKLLNGATGQLKLHLHLMLNCGFTQKDISDLRHDEIDLKKGVITRRRSKTRKKANTPLVSYRLWPETVELLRRYISTDPVMALLTTTEKKWVRKELDENGKLTKSDNIATNMQHLRKKTGVKKSLKHFRKTSATQLKGEPRFRGIEVFFLGHSPQSIADKNYAKESQTLLNEAIDWLRIRYGLNGKRQVK